MSDSIITELELIAFEDQLSNYSLNHPKFKYKFDEPLNPIKFNVDNLIKVIECPICFNDEDVINLGCNHYMCKSCCQTWFKNKIDNGDHLLKCSISTCKYKLSSNLIINTIFKDDINSVRKLKFNHYKQSIYQISEEFRHACNKPDCKGFFIKTSMKDNYVLCPVCFVKNIESNYCFKCNLYHSEKEHNNFGNKICYQTNKFLHNIFGINTKENPTDKLIKSLNLNTHKCPACGISCEKDESCNHVTCLNCGVEFNWKYEREWQGYKEEWKMQAVYKR